MPHAPRPPAYTATIIPYSLEANVVRAVRLSARQHRALTGLTVRIDLTSPSRWTPIEQAELAIQDVVGPILRGRVVSAVLWRDRDGGDLSVWYRDQFVPVAAVHLTHARTEVAA